MYYNILNPALAIRTHSVSPACTTITTNILTRSLYPVLFVDKVAVPTITCLINGTDNGGGDESDPRSLAELRCSAEGPPSLVTYDWMLVSGVRGGAALAVALRGEQDDTVYKCRATNPVSEETGTFVAKDCYPGEAHTMHNAGDACYRVSRVIGWNVSSLF